MRRENKITFIYNILYNFNPYPELHCYYYFFKTIFLKKWKQLKYATGNKITFIYNILYNFIPYQELHYYYYFFKQFRKKKEKKWKQLKNATENVLFLKEDLKKLFSIEKNMQMWIFNSYFKKIYRFGNLLHLTKLIMWISFPFTLDLFSLCLFSFHGRDPDQKLVWPHKFFFSVSWIPELIPYN